MMSSETVSLASRQVMPLVGFGLWKVPKDTAADTVYNAIKSGYRLFDGAYDYQNEKEAGEGVRRAIDEGLVKREDIFITTKLWNNYHSKEHALPMIEKQNVLGIGLYRPASYPFPGWWMEDGKTIKPAKASIRETWESLELAVDKGIARSIGVSNFQAQSLYDMFTYARHPVSSLQIEHHPYLTQPGLVAMAQSHDIAVTAYSSFGPRSFLELPPDFRQRAADVDLLFDAERITKIAEKYKRTPAQVLLRWATQRRIAVIPKSNNRDRLAQNLNVTSFDMSNEELESISALDKGLRFNDPGHYLPNHPLHIFA